MKVLVVGSSRRNEAPEHESVEHDPAAQKLQAAASELGKELASRGHTVVVGSDDPTDVDPYAVEGALKGGAKTVEVHVPHGSLEPYHDKPTVKTEWHQFPNWDVTVMEVIRDRVDAVIALGGRLGVIQAGLSAWMLDRPVIPIGSFGGGAKTIWEYSSGRRAQFYRGGINDTDIDRLAGPWGAEGSGPRASFVVDVLERVSTAAGVARVPQKFLFGIIFLLLVALGGWVYSVTYPLFRTHSDHGVGLDHLFYCVACAGVLGTMLQTLRMMRAGQAATSRKVVIDLGLGMVAGVVSAALYMIAQVALSGHVELTLGDEDFVRIALIVSTGALFSATYLDKAFSRFDEVSDQVIRGEFGQAKKE